MILLALAAAIAVLPSDVDLSQALGGAHGGVPPHVTNARCAPSSPGFIRCTYLESTPLGYSRWAVLVSNHGGRWSVSEGPIKERVKSVRKVR
jgi:hypothetical protein